MNKVAHYLQEHLLGEVTANSEVRRYFSTDRSVLQVPPAVVVYPRTEEDVRKAASFSWQLAKRGQVMPITPRGLGSDTTGGAIGPGILLVFPAHLNRLLSLDLKRKTIITEPGASYDKLDGILASHDLALSITGNNQATIGGGIAKNTVGKHSIKYGAAGQRIQSLRLVLANGEVIETKPLKHRELRGKLGETSFEGEIYRSLDKLLEENQQLIEEAKNKFQNVGNTAGYNIFNVKTGGHFDLTPLIVGSEGSLGIITEATIAVRSYNPETSICLISLQKLEDLEEVLAQIRKLQPASCEMLNRSALMVVSEINPNQLKNVLEERDSEIHLIVEFDDAKAGRQRDSLKSLKKLINHFDASLMIANDDTDKEQIVKIRDSVNTILNFAGGLAKAVPVAEAVSVPVDNVTEFMQQAYKIYKAVDLPPAAWGHIGDGIIRFQPLLDLAKLGDRQKLFRLSDDLYNVAVKLGGSINAGAGDGRLRAPYLKLQYGQELYELMMDVKKIFDPYGILNPGVKTASVSEIKALMRDEYSFNRHLEYLPQW